MDQDAPGCVLPHRHEELESVHYSLAINQEIYIIGTKSDSLHLIRMTVHRYFFRKKLRILRRLTRWMLKSAII
jgi:hypothetical protein